MKPAGQPEQASLNEYPKSFALHILLSKFLCNLYDTRTLIGPCSSRDLTLMPDQ